MKIYCVVVTYNGMLWIERCLKSLYESTFPVLPVIIDNGSTDGTRDFIKVNFPAAKLIESEVNLGFGLANNIGMQLARENDARYVFLLNQDAWIFPDTIGRLVKAAEAAPELGILSPVHLQANGRFLDRMFAVHIAPPSCALLDDIYANTALDEVYPCSFVNAAAWLISRNCIETVGLFEPFFFMYGEDSNYVQRLRFHQYGVGVVPLARAIHDRSDRSPAQSADRKKMAIRTYLYVKLLDVHRTLPARILQSCKVFVKYGFNRLALSQFISVAGKLFNLQRVVIKAKRKAYLLS